MRCHHSQRSTRRGVQSSTGPQLRVLPAVLVIGAAGLISCASDDDAPVAAGTADTPSSSSTQVTSSTQTISSTLAPAPDADADADAEPDAVAEVAAAFEEFAEAMESEDVDTLIELTSGPARVFKERAQHFGAATGIRELFANVHWEPGEVTVTDGVSAVVDGAIIWGENEAVARENTHFEYRHDGQRWLLDSFLRNGTPIGQWVTPGSDTPIDSGPVTVELVSTFTELTCMPGVESACPDVLRNGISLDLLVENRSDGDLQPGTLTLPDGTESPAWLETPSGGAYPLREAVVDGFPPTATVPVIGMFNAADDLAEGGVLHLVLRTPDGTDHRFDVPVAPYPYEWTDDPSRHPTPATGPRIRPLWR